MKEDTEPFCVDYQKLPNKTSIHTWEIVDTSLPPDYTKLILEMDRNLYYKIKPLQ